MNSAYKIEAKGEDCFYAYAKIKSDFYITAIMHSPNTTATDVKYCCAKKWGQYQLASFPGAPMSLTQAKTEVGSKFAFAGSWDFPYAYLASNPTMVHDRDVLTGGTRCDDVIFDNARVIQKDLTYFDISLIFTFAPISYQ